MTARPYPPGAGPFDDPRSPPSGGRRMSGLDVRVYRGYPQAVDDIFRRPARQRRLGVDAGDAPSLED